MKAEVLVKCVKEGRPGEWPPTDHRASMVGAPPGPTVGEVEVWATRELRELPFRPREGTPIRTKGFPVAPTHMPLRIESIEIDVDNDRVCLFTQAIRTKSDQDLAALLQRFRAAGWSVSEPKAVDAYCDEDR